MEGQDLAIYNRPYQTKADRIFALSASGKAGVNEQCGLMHQAMRVMVYTINPTDRDSVTRNKFHLILLLDNCLAGNHSARRFTKTVIIRVFSSWK
jgi:hypothetical protein